jgi:serine/threonine-protein kinase
MPPDSDIDPPSAAAPGTVLAGKYRVERVLGEGGMGVVVLATHLDLDERVALKFLRPEFAKHQEAAPRFLREARAAVKIKSAHVARVLDVGRLERDAPFMVMEFLQGSDLGAVVGQTGRLPIEDAVDYVIQASEALAEAHSYGIVHRDIKPSNLFLTRKPDGHALVKVLDFGISKLMGDGVEVLTRTSAAMGSAPYMSPEQMESTRGVDVRTDIYSLGVTLYELLSGRLAFQGESTPQLCALVLKGAATPLRDVVPDVPPELETVVRRAFARDAADRYPTVAAFVAALAPFAPERSQPVVAAIQRIAAGPRLSQPSYVDPVALATAATEASGPQRASNGEEARTQTITPATAAGVTSTPANAPRGRRSPWAIVAGLGAVALLGGAGVLATRGHGGPVDVAAASPSVLPPPSALPAPRAATDPSPSASTSAAVAAASPASASRRVFLVIEPADAVVEIDGVKVEAHKGVVDLEGAPGSVHVVTLTKDKSHMRGDVVITEAGALPPKLELTVPKAAAPAKPAGKTPRFGFDE